MLKPLSRSPRLLSILPKTITKSKPLPALLRPFSKIPKPVTKTKIIKDVRFLCINNNGDYYEPIKTKDKFNVD